MIQIAIADDHMMFREGLVSLLSSDDKIIIVGQASNGSELLELLDGVPADVVILDIEMPEMDGFEVLRQLKRMPIAVKTLVLTMHSSPQFIKNIFMAGASGYLPKDAGKTKLLEAIESLYRTGRYHSPETINIVMDLLKEDTLPTAISPREKEVIKLIADGNTTHEIAEKLYLSKYTVESHRKNILLKLDLKNSAALVKYAIHKGLIYQ